MTDTNNIEVGRPANDAELKDFLRIVSQALFFPNANLNEWVRREGKENIRVARRRGRVVGGLIVQKMGQWFGGTSVPMTAVRVVGVAPEHRGGGVASRLMRAALVEMHGDRVSLSTLFPATQPVYRRVGYEQAGVRLRYRMPAGVIDLHDRSLSVRPMELGDDHDVHRLYAERASRTAGNLDRNRWAWQRLLDPPPWQTPIHGYLVQRESIAEGYILFSQKPGQPLHKNVIEVADLVAGTADAARQLLTFLADHRSMAEWIHWCGPPVDPLGFTLAEQQTTITERIDWMLRIVDVCGALESRGYPAAIQAELHLEVADDVLAHNHRRFILEVADGAGRVREGGRGDLHTDIRGLAAMYTGHLSAIDLKTTGYVEGPDNVLAMAAYIFAGPAPWMPDLF